MGSCLSSTSSSPPPVDKPNSTAYVISSANGELREYTVPINVSQVLALQSNSNNSFVCNSDRLYFDDFIPPLSSEYQLQPGQIYFLLPSSKLHYRLSAADMAALALKASSALQDLNNNTKTTRRNKFLFIRRNGSNNKKNNSRISPMMLQVESDEHDYYNYNNKMTASTSTGLGVSMRSASVKKLQRLSSRRAKLAVRSFRKLMTIQEGSVLLFN